jgi:GT2 family glycosyltransferase
VNGRATFCVPIYRGEAFLRDALRAIQAQTFTDFDVVMSIDGADPVCEAICAEFVSDARFTLAVQPQRLGWVDNFNWTLASVDNEFCLYQQQDDLIDPAYLETLVHEAQREPSAAVVYCDLVSMGKYDGVVRPAPSVIGATAFQRMMTMVREHLVAVPFRGLVRTDALPMAGPVQRNAVADFGVDILWLTALARWGDLRRVPLPLYRKRYHDHNTESKWWAWPLDQRLEAWCHHSVAMVNEAMKVQSTAQAMRLLWLAGVERLTSLVTAGPFLQLEELEPTRYTWMLERFLELAKRWCALDVPRQLDASWEEIERWTREAFWTPDLTPVDIVAFGPQSVARGQTFNAQPDGGSAVWIQAHRRIAPGTRIRFAGVELTTSIAGDVATAVIPPTLVAWAGDRPLCLVGSDGSPRSNVVMLRIDATPDGGT